MLDFAKEALKATGKALDVAGYIHNTFSSTAEEVVATIADEVKEEVKEIAKSPSIVDATKAVAVNVVDAASTALVQYVPAPAPEMCPNNLTLLSTALTNYLPEMNSTVKDAAVQGSSYLPYLATAATLLTGGFAAYKLRGTKATLQTLMQDKASYGLIEGTIEILQALNELMKNPTIVEIIKLLTPAQAAKLVENKDTLAEIASLKDAAQQLLAVQTLLTPAPVAAVSNAVADLNDVLRQVASSSSSVEATQSAPVDLAASIVTSEAGKVILAKVRASERASAVLEKMNEASLKTLNANSAKFIASPTFATMNNATLADLLVKTAAAAKQIIVDEYVAAKPAAKLK